MSPFHILSLCLICACAAANVDLIVVGGIQEFCLGASVTLQCTVTGDILIWKTTTGDINLVRNTSGSSGTQLQGYHWTLLQLNVTHTQSNLTFYYNETLRTPNCSTSDQKIVSVALQTEGPPGAPDRPMTSFDRINISETLFSLSVMWKTPTTNFAHISSYVVTVDPPISLPDDGVIAADNPLFNFRQLTLTLQHDQQYNISVRAKSCNDTVTGILSPPLILSSTVPPKIEQCNIILRYDYFSGDLTSIKVVWKPIQDNIDTMADDILTGIQKYVINIFFAVSLKEDVNIIIPNLTMCNDNICSYSLHNIAVMSTHNYSVFVTAIAQFGGYSEKMCDKLSILAAGVITEQYSRTEKGAVIQFHCQNGYNSTDWVISQYTINYTWIPNLLTIICSEYVASSINPRTTLEIQGISSTNSVRHSSDSMVHIITGSAAGVFVLLLLLILIVAAIIYRRKYFQKLRRKQNVVPENNYSELPLTQYSHIEARHIINGNSEEHSLVQNISEVSEVVSSSLRSEENDGSDDMEHAYQHTALQSRVHTPGMTYVEVNPTSSVVPPLKLSHSEKVTYTTVIGNIVQPLSSDSKECAVSEASLDQILIELQQVIPDWKKLAKALKIEQIDQIQDYATSDKEAMVEVVDIWLRNLYPHIPKWIEIADVVEEIGYTELACSLKQVYVTGECL